MTQTLEIKTARVFKPLLAPSRYKAAHGGRGSGKSHFFAELGVERALMQPGFRWVCAREVQRSLKESAKRLIEDKIEYLGLGSEFRILNDRIETPGNGVIIFQGLQDHTAESIKSLEAFDVAWVEEARSLSARSLRILLPTIRKDGSELWFSWNRQRKADPVDALFTGEHPPPGAVVVKSNWSDNPWFPKVLDEQRRYDLDHNPQFYGHIWEGEYAGITEGAYFAKDLALAKSEGRIGKVSRDPLMEIRAFWDLGVEDAMAIWIAQFIGKSVNVLDYIEGSGQALGYYTSELRNRGYDGCLCVLPHDGARRDSVTAVKFEDHLKDAGFRVKTITNQGKGAAMLRVEAARRLFPRIWFNEQATQAGIEALGAYHERKDDERQVGLGPEHDWCLAAGTQVLTTTGWRPVETIAVHDHVLTPLGHRRILRSGIVRMASEWATIKGIRCTPEHRFFTSRGLVEAGDVLPQEKFWTQGDWGLRILASLCAASRLGLKAAITSATRHTPRESAGLQCSYTGWFMRLCTAQFRQATRSIMAMMTRLTTTQTTLKLCPSLNTAAATSPSLDMSAFVGFVGESSVAIRHSALGAVKRASGATVPDSRVSTEPAYNLTVERDECYFVRGSDGLAYLVSNSSHGADAFGLMCVAYEGPKLATKPARNPFGILQPDQSGAWLGS